MVTIRVAIKGLDELRAEFGKLGGVFDEVVEEEIHAEAKRYQKRVKALHKKGPHTGVIYSRPGGRSHQASAAGQPPAPDTRKLMRSIKVKLGKMSATVFSLLDYSFWLEFSSRRMAARPMWIPSLPRSRTNLPRNIERALRKKL